MKGIKIFLIFMISFFCFDCSVNAAMCDDADISRLSQLAKKVYANYEYVELNYDETNDEVVEDDGTPIVLGAINNYYVYVNGLSDELYLVFNDENYYYDSVQDGVLLLESDSGRIQLNIYSTRCDGILLHTISLTLPTFNKYSLTDECKELKDLNLEVCKKWNDKIISDDTFYSIVNQYISYDEEEKNIFDKIMSFSKKYYLYIVGGVFLIVLFIIFYFIHRKRSVLE